MSSIIKKENCVPSLRFPSFDTIWEQISFNDAFDIVQNNTFARADLNYKVGNVKNIHYGDVLIKFGEYIDVQQRNVPFINSEKDLSKFKTESYLRNGDIIIADTAEDETVGKAAEISNIEKEKVLAGLHTIPCRPIRKFAPIFLGLYMNSESFHKQLLPLITGIKVSSISKTSIATTKISVPQLEEQEKISKFLITISKIIKEQESSISTFETYNRGLISKIFKQEIRFKDENGNQFPDWKNKKMKECVIIQRGSSPRPIEDYITDANDGINWIKIGDAPIDGNIITEVKERITMEGSKKSRRVYVGDLILSNSMSFGRPYILGVDGCIHDGWLLIRNKQNLFNLKYLCYLLASEEVIKQYKMYAAGSTVNNLNSELVQEVAIQLPCLEEQQKVADFITAMDRVLEQEKAYLDQLKAIKKGLLQQMFV